MPADDIFFDGYHPREIPSESGNWTDSNGRRHYNGLPTTFNFPHWANVMLGWVVVIGMLAGTIFIVRVTDHHRHDEADKYNAAQRLKFSDFCGTLAAKPVFRTDAWLCVANSDVKYKMTNYPYKDGN